MNRFIRFWLYLFLASGSHAVIGKPNRPAASPSALTVYQGADNTVIKRVDFGTGFELTVKYIGELEEVPSSYFTIETSLIDKDGVNRQKYKDEVRRVASPEPNSPNTVIHCRPESSYTGGSVELETGGYKPNTFDSQVHTLTIRERRVKSNYTILQYIDGVLVNELVFGSDDDRFVMHGISPRNPPGEIKIETFGKVRIVDYQYRKLEGDKRYFLHFSTLNPNTFQIEDVIVKPSRSQSFISTRLIPNLNAWGYVLIQWIVLDGSKSSVDYWGYWPDKEGKKIIIGNSSGPLESYALDEASNQGTSFRCEITEQDYFRSVERRKQWMNTPGLFFFTGTQCVEFTNAVASSLTTSFSPAPSNNVRRLATPSDLIRTELNYPHLTRHLSLEDIYYPIDSASVSVNLSAGETVEQKVDMSTRQGAYIGTLKYKPGTVGASVNSFIGGIHILFRGAGQAKIGALFNRPDVQVLLAKENTWANNYAVAKLEYDYWDQVLKTSPNPQDRVGGVLGIAFDPWLRTIGQWSVGKLLELNYNAVTFLNPYIINLKDEVEQLRALAIYRRDFLTQLWRIHRDIQLEETRQKR